MLIQDINRIFNESSKNYTTQILLNIYFQTVKLRENKDKYQNPIN